MSKEKETIIELSGNKTRVGITMPVEIADKVKSIAALERKSDGSRTTSNEKYVQLLCEGLGITVSENVDQNN